MSRSKRLWWCGLIGAGVLGTTMLHAGEIDLQALLQETQKMTQNPNELTLVWWLPEEYWKAVFAQTPGMRADQMEEFLNVIRQYTMVVVIDGTVGPFGGVTFKSEDWIRANTRCIDAKGISYAPKTEEEVDADTKQILQILRPMMANVLGPTGQNMHFLLFPAKTTTGARLAPAREKGVFKVRVGAREFKWRLPLDALLPVKICPGCNEQCKGSWNFCPWCGKPLEQKEP